ncbi:MAG: hypothetical protein ACEPOW_05635 [Bacteroidales bacterium]
MSLEIIKLTSKLIIGVGFLVFWMLLIPKNKEKKNIKFEFSLTALTTFFSAEKNNMLFGIGTYLILRPFVDFDSKYIWIIIPLILIFLFVSKYLLTKYISMYKKK